MLFKDIIGQKNIKTHLTKTASNGRTPHAQLFIAPTGSGALPMAIAYAQYILCQNRPRECCITMPGMRKNTFFMNIF